MSDYPEDQADRNAVASVERDIGWVTGQVPGSQHAPRPAASSGDETLKRVIGLLVDSTWWLDTCSDEDVDEWVAGNLQENTAYFLAGMPDEQRSRFLEVIEELAVTERHEGRRYEMRFFPFAMGLVETEPIEAKPLRPGYGP
ncbi:hypothetical protein [Actinoplanes utahensis]|uniref:hypothetical protein n=1 Tax=Actinoplanes utahensis TaxID=1869 RepID=UPI00126A20E6|nr:hypothetical protein [Actinoplanes utahensis]